jgi:hypothetical protein
MTFNHRPGKPRQCKLHSSQEFPSHVSASDSLGCRSEVCQNFNHVPSHAAAWPRICEPMPHSLRQVLKIAKSVLIAKWDWRICSAESATMLCPGFSGAPEHRLYAYKILENHLDYHFAKRDWQLCSA